MTAGGGPIGGRPWPAPAAAAVAGAGIGCAVSATSRMTDGRATPIESPIATT